MALLDSAFLGHFSCHCGFIKQHSLTVCISGVSGKGKNTEQWRCIDAVSQTQVSQLDADLRNERLLTSGPENMFLFSCFWCRLPVNKTAMVQRKSAENTATMLIVAVGVHCVLSVSVICGPSSKEVSWSKGRCNCGLCHYAGRIIYMAHLWISCQIKQMHKGFAAALRTCTDLRTCLTVNLQVHLLCICEAVWFKNSYYQVLWIHTKCHMFQKFRYWSYFTAIWMLLLLLTQKKLG